MSTIDAEQHLLHYLCQCSEEVENNRDENGIDYARVTCETCNASRSLFCAECSELLLPFNQWPHSLLDKSLFLPFDVDIILHDRRLSATGVQIHTIFSSMDRHARTTGSDEGIGTRPSTSCRLFDVDRNDDIPHYSDTKTDGTYLLFPGESSLPLSTVIDDEGVSLVKRLVVLDCKWSSSSIRLHPHLKRLQHVYLDHAPKHSYFWRWHSAGENMLSTAEAVYYSAWAVATTRPDISDDERAKMVHILWLFGLIREIIQSRYKEGRVQSFIHPPAVPFLESSKEFYRLLRKQNKNKEKKTEASVS